MIIPHLNKRILKHDLHVRKPLTVCIMENKFILKLQWLVYMAMFVFDISIPFFFKLCSQKLAMPLNCVISQIM